MTNSHLNSDTNGITTFVCLFEELTFKLLKSLACIVCRESSLLDKGGMSLDDAPGDMVHSIMRMGQNVQPENAAQNEVQGSESNYNQFIHRKTEDNNSGFRPPGPRLGPLLLPIAGPTGNEQEPNIMD